MSHNGAQLLPVDTNTFYLYRARRKLAQKERKQQELEKLKETELVKKHAAEIRTAGSQKMKEELVSS